MGQLFIGRVWGKDRPMIEIEKDGVTYHAGISHTTKEGMIPLTEDDLEEGADFPLDKNSYAGLCNKSRLQDQLGEIGNTKAEFDDRLLEANPKLKEKVEKRSKK
jgi:hypothetical protein